MNINRRSLMTAAAVSPLALAAPSVLTQARAEEGTVKTPSGSLPLYQRTKVGDIEVTILLDGYAQFPTAMMNGFTADTAEVSAKAAYKSFDPNFFTIGINGYLIRTGDRVIAVDTGAPGVMAPTVGRWQTAREAAGIAAEDVDTLFLTHLHVDHVGGLSDALAGGSKRLMPNAEFICSHAEWAFTHDDALYNSLPKQFQQSFDMSRALVAPYAETRREITMKETEVAPGVTAVPLPGHTPGHMGLLLESSGEQLLIWGDVIHAPAYQFANPDWSVVFDADPATAHDTRIKMYDRAAADRLMIAGMHLDFPAFGYVEKTGSSYRYVTAPIRFAA